MNVIWIVADTLRRDHIGAYGNPEIKTPVLDALAARSTRFDAHYASGFPTMPSRADYFTGRWTISFMGWEPLAQDTTTIGQILAEEGVHTAAVVDTPFFWRHGNNYDRGFQTYFTVQGQEGSGTRIRQRGHHESRDLLAWWRKESDRNVAQTMIRAGDWLERHYKEQFFLYVDTWDPHEPWNAPPYFTELYMPDYDGKIVQPTYAHWHDDPTMSEARMRKAHATYCGEVTMVDTWVGYLLRKVENMGIADDTAIIFTSDHGFYFGEHGGRFGKMCYGKRPDGSLYRAGDPDGGWTHSPLYEEIVRIPLLLHVPGISPGRYSGQTSAVDLMPTVLDIYGQPVPDWVDGKSLLAAAQDPAVEGYEYAVTTIPFANPGDRVRSVDNVSRPMLSGLVTTVTAGNWTLLYTVEPGMSELYDLSKDPAQEKNVIREEPGTARELHQLLVKFMRDTNLAEHLMQPRLELRP